ncbi:MAG: hypothetical protein WCV68_01800 [Candidatus Paceibacterota bacterium]
MGYQPYGSNLDDIAYRVNFDPNILCILVNGHELSRLHSKTDIADFFEYVNSHPNIAIKLSDLKKLRLKKGLDDILRDIGFRGILAKMFFPKMTNSEIIFRNPIYQKDLEELGIDYVDAWILLHTPKRKGAFDVTS